MTAPVPSSAGRWGAASSRALGLLGPALVIGCVLIVLRDVAFLGKVPSQNSDLTGYFFPNYCFLGTSLAAGHVPAWNPFAMGGVRFAADPQSGWGYLPAMALFSALPCGEALRLFVLLQPILGGLGAYGFLRSEGCARPAATIGGVVLALGLAGSSAVASVPFAGAVAWTTILLACTSKVFRGAHWGSRVPWAVAAAAAWGQIAAAHMSHGLVIGTTALVAYCAAAAWRSVQERAVAGREVAIMLGILLIAMAGVNLAFFLPRLAYLPTTSLAEGYTQLERLTGSLSGVPVRPSSIEGASSWGWVGEWTTPGGVYAAGAGLLLYPAALWTGRHRPLAMALTALGLVTYLATQEAVASQAAPTLAGHAPFDFYLHIPSRFGYGLLVAVPLLVGLGADAWIERASTSRRLLMAVPAVVAALALAFLGPSGGATQAFVVVPGVVASAVILAVAAHRPAWLWLLGVVVAVELSAAAVVDDPSTRQGRFGALSSQRIPAADLVAEGPLLSPILPGTGRLLTLGGSEVEQRVRASLNSLPLHIEEAQGYNPAQSLRYWRFVRAMNEGVYIEHNSAVFRRPPEAVFDLLQVGWVIAPRTLTPRADWRPVETDQGRVLYRVTAVVPRATAVTDWVVVDDADQALALVRARGSARGPAVVEGDLGPAPPVPGHARVTSFRSGGWQAASVGVRSDSPSVLVVRTTFDSNWRASIDGRPAPIAPVDSILIGVHVPAGTHTVALRYDDPWVRFGLIGSGLVVAIMLGAAGVLRSRSATRRPAPAGT